MTKKIFNLDEANENGEVIKAGAIWPCRRAAYNLVHEIVFHISLKY